MSDETPRLHLPQLVSQQEMTNVTWNEALAQLDALIDLILLGQFVNDPPAGPQDGDAYLLGAAPTAAWSGYSYKIAVCLDGGWRFYTPFDGLTAFVVTANTRILYRGGTWIAIGATDFATKSGAETLANKTLAGATLTGHLLFTDATYDIGIWNANRPRNLYLSGSVNLGGPTVQTTNDDQAYTNYFQFRKRRLTGDSLRSADQLGAFIFQGYDGAAYRDGAYVRAKADGNYSAGSAPTCMQFCVTPNGASAAQVRLHIAQDGTSSFYGSVLPGADNTYALGAPGSRWSALHCVSVVTDALRLATSAPPSSAAAAGSAGQITYDGTYLYVCVAANTWKRAALSTW